MRILIVGTVIAITLAGPAGASEAVDVGNRGPLHGRTTVALQEIWRTGHQDGVVLGAPVGALADDTGRVVVCDHQTATLLVVGPGGTQDPVLARPGEGPGELAMPVALAAWPGGGYGVAEFFPGRVTVIAEDGTPAGFVAADPTPGRDGGFTLLTSLAVGGGNVVVSGFYQTPTDNGMLRNDFLASLAADGGLTTRYINRETILSPDARSVREVDYLGRMHLATAVLQDGRVLVAERSAEYAIDVYDPEGALSTVIGRPFEARNRTERERRMVAALFEAWNGDRPDPPVVEMLDKAPPVDHLQVDGRGDLWVRHSDSGRLGKERGGFLTLDRFSDDGRWLQEVTFSCPGDPDLDELLILDESRVLVIRHYRLSRLIRFSAIAGRTPTFGLAGEERPLEVICYRRTSGALR